VHAAAVRFVDPDQCPYQTGGYCHGLQSLFSYGVFSLFALVISVLVSRDKSASELISGGEETGEKRLRQGKDPIWELGTHGMAVLCIFCLSKHDLRSGNMHHW
jgi:hypothetical protein